MEQLSERVFEILGTIPKSLYLPIFLAMAGLICLSIGLIQLVNSHQENASQNVSQPETVESSASAAIFGMKIDVEGAVVRPGVYALPQNSRVQDALVAAGGLSSSADREVVAKSLNLAAKVTDGIKIYVPKVGETAVLGTSTIESNPTDRLGQAGLININSASESQLDTLEGVGPVTAQKIIAARPYATIDELVSKKAVTNSVFQKIKEKVTAY